MTPKATRAIFGVSPMPNQMMNSGMRPTNGTVRIICTDASMRSSPSRNSPAISARRIPTDPPSSTPLPARRSDTAIAFGSSPLLTRSAKVVTTVHGEASRSVDVLPLQLAICHSSSRSSGPTGRRIQRGTPRRLAADAVTVISVGALRAGVPLVAACAPCPSVSTAGSGTRVVVSFPAVSVCIVTNSPLWMHFWHCRRSAVHKADGDAVSAPLQALQGQW